MMPELLERAIGYAALYSALGLFGAIIAGVFR
jgi:hypothetical protein